MAEEILIRFRLVGDEAQALRTWASEELRKPRDQLHYILRQELLRHGRLPECCSDDLQTCPATGSTCQHEQEASDDEV